MVRSAAPCFFLFYSLLLSVRLSVALLDDCDVDCSAVTVAFAVTTTLTAIACTAAYLSLPPILLVTTVALADTPATNVNSVTITAVR